MLPQSSSMGLATINNPLPGHFCVRLERLEVLGRVGGLGSDAQCFLMVMVLVIGVVIDSDLYIKLYNYIVI